jgi:shikimate kinase / 3-dehydroquinate synthase
LAGALDKSIALVGFMGAGKTTRGKELAERIGRSLVDLDAEIEEEVGATIHEIFRNRGEAEFRRIEERAAAGALTRDGAVVVLGGGAVQSERTRELLRKHSITLWLDVDVETAWNRAGGERPLARDERDFRELYEQRRPLYEQVADARVEDLDDAVLAAGGVRVGLGALEELDRLAPSAGRLALVADPHVSGIYGAQVQLALGNRLASTHELPAGEEAKSFDALQGLLGELKLERGDGVVALGGGCTTDAAGFAASVYLRGIDWIAVPTSLVGQVDAAIGGKTGINLPNGKNLAGAFHWPARTVIDPAALATLPERERRAGMAEVVKAGLLAGEPLWELPDAELVRRCAAFKTAVCLRDPHDEGERQVLNLGHTFAHALEAASGYALPHGEAVALGLLAALRLSGRPTDVVEEVLHPKRVEVDRERAWAALQRDKKARAGELRLVLLGDEGPFVAPVPAGDVRSALDALIAG